MTDTEMTCLALLGAILDGDAAACRAIDDLFMENGHKDPEFRFWPILSWWNTPREREYFVRKEMWRCKVAGLIQPFRSSLDIPKSA